MNVFVFIEIDEGESGDNHAVDALIGQINMLLWQEFDDKNIGHKRMIGMTSLFP